MIVRRPILLLIGTIAIVGFGLFWLTYQVQDLEDELARLNRAILAGQEAIHVLEAEWSYLNRPARLEALNDRHLGLGPLSEAHIGDIAGLPRGNAGDSAPAEQDPPTHGPDLPPAGPPPTGATLASARIIR
jgi:cell division protein FtsL